MAVPEKPRGSDLEPACRQLEDFHLELVSSVRNRPTFFNPAGQSLGRRRISECEGQQERFGFAAPLISEASGEELLQERVQEQFRTQAGQLGVVIDRRGQG